MRPVRSLSRLRIAAALAGSLMLLGMGPNATGPSATPAQTPQEVQTFAIPTSVLMEMAELHTGIELATRVGGMTGDTAQRVLTLLDAHYAKERRDAFPLLRLLPAMSQSGVEPWMTELAPVADRLRTELPTLHEEHLALAVALNQLADAAWAEDHPAFAFAAQRARRQFQLEEEVLYPAALVAADAIRQHGTR